MERASALVFPVLVFAAALYMSGSVALLGLDMHHDGLMYDAARDFLRGEVPYRDFFYQYNIGTLLAHALSLRVLGDSIASLKIATAFAYAVLAVLLYANVALAAVRWKALLIAAGWLTLSPFFFPTLNGFHAWSTYFMMIAIAAGSLFLVRSTQRGSRGRAFAAGACFCAAFWFKQIALLQGAAVVAWLVYSSFRGAKERPAAQPYRTVGAWFLAGGIALALPIVGYLAVSGALADWWLAVFLFNSKFAVQVERESILSVIRLFFPIHAEFGYISIFWAVLPPFLLAVTLLPAGAGPVILRTDPASRLHVLYFLLAMAGWLEYYPLPHPFHLHLYMVPAFCLIAWSAPAWPPGPSMAGKAIFVCFAILLGLFAYETARHVKAFTLKVYRGDYVTIPGKDPASGLRVDRKHYVSIANFHETYREFASTGPDSAAIPFSVDPVQALFPYRRSEFKMPVDWTWVNGLLDPSFHSRRAAAIGQRRALLHADGILAVPGYRPVAMLDIPSPFSNQHVLYAPDEHRPAPPSLRTMDGDAFSRLNGVAHHRAVKDCTDPLFVNRMLVPFPVQPGMTVRRIRDMHATLISDRDIPRRLDPLEYSLFLKPSAQALEGFSGVADAYAPSPPYYRLKEPLDGRRSFELASFFLFHGKKFPRYYATTLAGSAEGQPVLLALGGGRCPSLIWSKAWQDRRASLNRESLLALPHRVYFFPDGMETLDAPITVYLQVRYDDDSTRSYFIRIGDVDPPGARFAAP